MSAADEHAWIAIGSSEALSEGGDGLRFELPMPGRGMMQAFCVRHEGVLRAYLNQCAHVPVELDWQPGRFFDTTGLYLICATHGAVYLPDNGLCVGGPCKGRSLVPVAIREEAGQLWARPLDRGRSA